MTELGSFLATCRARVEPADIGLPGGGRRRVPGLRREELALLAGISAEYYQRLEQGRAAHPSDEVLDAIADVLRLDRVERGHLRALARPARRAGPSAPKRVRPELRRMLNLMTAAPALIITDTFTVLAANPLAQVMFEPLVPLENLARSLFTDPAARAFYLDRSEVATATVAQLHLVLGRYPGDRDALALVDELSSSSTEFAALWRSGGVTQRTHGSKRFDHPAVGEFAVDYENLELPGDPRHRLVTFLPTTAYPTVLDRLQQLAAHGPSTAEPEVRGLRLIG
ncbi:helix-turn-helix domain-containing protein [Nocardia stercoris]|uniref:XRE family transcriptional regulator n=1 Tax=Nocardia stercoris TaxID=2483361 RepID=A0A3M2LEW8_9NOCA|nr:helix-turn-helix transcriptional regulator [Nocardia stercoris]RMI35340.1 XRE family transcriptional regulator [Nocardia stercoris]